jgi:hypothetical protein
MVGAGDSDAADGAWRKKTLTLQLLREHSKNFRLNLPEEFLAEMLRQAAATSGGGGSQGPAGPATPALVTLEDFERVMTCTHLY